MTVATQCLSPEQAESLIHGSLPEWEQEKLTDHVGTCSICQETLQMAATGEIAIESLVAKQSTQLPASDSAYWPTIHSLRSEFEDAKLTTAPTAAVKPAPATPVLSFLQPSDDPAYLGKLDHFEIARIIGRGGMGIVFEAFDTHLQRPVAIKVLNPEFAKHDTARQRFCREGRAAGAISHEHVVSMYQVSKYGEGKIAYLVMQLIEGDTLEKLLEGDVPFSSPEVARIGMQIAAGLSAAHARSMVHRDIKPANILIEKQTNRVKLTDFGLARATDDVKLTKTGMVTGTPLYMSPEQATGAVADERSDLFSFGAVMYEMATGKAPFAAPSMYGVMKRVMEESPEPPHRVNPAISRPLSDVIMALLEKKPEDRPQSAADVANVLASIVTEFGPISPLQVPAVGLASASGDARRLSGRQRAISRRLTVVSTAIAAVVLLGLGAAVGLWVASSNTQPDANDLTKSEQARFPSVLLAGNPGTVWSVDFVPGADRVVAAIEDGSIRVWDIPIQKVVKSFSAHRGIIWMVQYHPSRPMMASSGDDGMIKLWDANSFELIREWKATNAVRSIAFSPDGARIAAGDREGVIHIYDLDSGKEIISKTQPGSIFGVAYSGDGKLIATVGTDKTVRAWDAESLDERQSLIGHDGPIYNVDFAPSGPLLATVGWGKGIHIWNVETGEQVANLQGSHGDSWGVSFCQDGTHLVTSGQDGITRVWEVATGHEVAQLGGHESAVHNVSLDPSQHRIATSGRDGSVRIWDLTSLNNREQ